MVVAIVVLGIACAELSVALGYMIYKYHKLDKDTTDEVMTVIQEIHKDEAEREFDLSFPNTEGDF